MTENLPATKLKSKIELAGENVMNHLFEMAKSTDLSYASMAERVNDSYGIQISRQDVYRFFKKNASVIENIANENSQLSSLRAKLTLDFNASMVKDIKLFDREIEKVSKDEFLDGDRRAKVLGDLLDKKGRLLLRFARLSGKLIDSRTTNIDKQINVYQKVENDNSELIQRMKRVEFNKNSGGEIIDADKKASN